MNRSDLQDNWAVGVDYEPYVGRWSRLIARDFLYWLAIPPQSRWLDVGCGTGALSQTILEEMSPQSVLGVDGSVGFLRYARFKLQGLQHIGFLASDAQSHPIKPSVYDVVVSGLVLNFVLQPGKAISEMVRVVVKGGTVAVYVWDYAGQMQMMRAFWDAAVDLDPAAHALDEGERFPLCQPQPLRELFQAGGLGKVEVREIIISTLFRDFDDYWTPFLGGQGPAPSYVRSIGEKRRDALRERLRVTLPIAADGSIKLTARAWAVRGIRER